VQPLIAMALGLKAAGHDVRFAAPADFEEWVRGCGLDFFRLTGRATAFFGGAAGTAMRDRLRDAAAFERFFQDYMGTFLDKLLLSCWEACEDADAIFCWSWTRAGPSLAEKLDVPLFVVSPNPVLHLPTSTFANPFHGPEAPPLGPLYNWLSWRWALPFTRVGQPQVDRWRTKVLGLPKLDWATELRRLRRLPHLFGYSPSILPKPWDWPQSAQVTGYWFLDEPGDYAPPEELAAFLDSGAPPVVVGFSSQVGQDSKRLTQAVVDGLKRSGRRALLVSGWGGLKNVELPPEILRVSSVPYDWLLPRCAALVHQGGSGSAGAAFRAGIPSFAVPFGYDQALWGRRIARLGVGPRPIPAADLAPEPFAQAVGRVCEDPTMKRKAADLAARIGAEDGIGRAVEIVERTIGAIPRRRADIPEPKAFRMGSAT
jgi:UDP:flavonoid glycosyltransferase YjiC (YdhE family)